MRFDWADQVTERIAFGGALWLSDRKIDRRAERRSRVAKAAWPAVIRK